MKEILTPRVQKTVPTDDVSDRGDVTPRDDITTSTRRGSASSISSSISLSLDDISELKKAQQRTSTEKRISRAQTYDVLPGLELYRETTSDDLAVHKSALRITSRYLQDGHEPECIKLPPINSYPNQAINSKGGAETEESFIKSTARNKFGEDVKTNSNELSFSHFPAFGTNSNQIPTNRTLSRSHTGSQTAPPAGPILPQIKQRADTKDSDKRKSNTEKQKRKISGVM